MTPSGPRPRSSAERAGELFLAFAILYLPLEEFLLKWAPGGDAGYVALRLGFEAALYAALLVLIAARRARVLRLPRTPIDRPLAAFLALALGSLALSDGSWLAGLVNLRVLLRYVAVFYLAVYLAPPREVRRRLLGLVLVSAALQGGLGLVQHLQGGASEFWLPRAQSVEVGGVSREFTTSAGGLEQGAVLGTTDHSVAFALLLLVAGTLAAALLLARAVPGSRARGLVVAGLALAVFGIFFSYVRSCLLGLALAGAVLLWLERREPRVARLIVPGALAAALALGIVLLWPSHGASAGFVREKETQVSPLESVEALFTSEYLESAQSSRLWILRDVGGEIARSAGWLGFGPDPEYVKERLLRSGGAALHQLIAYRAFEDVYWVALLAYYGFLGLALFLAVLASLVPAALAARRAAREPWERAAAASLFALLVVVVPLSFLAPTFDFRTFAFAFWLLAGLVLAPDRGRIGSLAVPALPAPRRARAAVRLA